LFDGGLLLIAIVNWLTSEDGVAAIGPTGEAVHTFEDRDIASIVNPSGSNPLGCFVVPSGSGAAFCASLASPQGNRRACFFFMTRQNERDT
jgi:hypothetical protein